MTDDTQQPKHTHYDATRSPEPDLGCYSREPDQLDAVSRASGRYICLDCGKKFNHERKASNHKHNAKLCVDCGTHYTDRCALNDHEYIGKECWVKRPSLHFTWDDPILILAQLKYRYFHCQDVPLHSPTLDPCDLCGAQRWVTADPEELDAGELLYETAVCTACGNQTPYPPTDRAE